MLLSLFWTLFAAAAGTGGLWIVALFVPSFALLLKSALDFLRSPLGLVLAVIGGGLFLFVAGWIGGDIHGTNATRAAWRRSDALKAEAARRIIETNRQAAAADADNRIATIDAFAKTLAQKVKRYESENADRAGMRLTADDVKRMLDGLR